MAGRTIDINSQIFGIDLQIHFFGLRKNGHRTGAGLLFSGGVCHRDTLNAVNTAFIFQQGPGTGTGHHKDGFFESAQFCLIKGNRLEAEMMAGCKMFVHPHQIGSKKTGFFTAGTGPDFHNHRTVIVWILREEQELKTLFHGTPAFLKLSDFLLGELLQVRIGSHLMRLGKVLQKLLVGIPCLNLFFKHGALFQGCLIGFGIGDHFTL